MPLEARTRKQHYIATTLAEMSALIHELMDELGGAENVEFNGRRYYASNHVAELTFSDDLLAVSLDKNLGYGALIWCVQRSSPRKGGICDNVWVSDNPTPLGDDPKLVADPDTPSFHDRRNAVPTSDVRKALEDYCRTRERPTCISWVKGRTDGSRLDQE